MATWGGFDYANIIANRQKDTFIHGFLDISGNTIITNGDVSISTGNLIANYDASINGNVTIVKTITTTSLINTYDASINGNLTIGKTLTTTSFINTYDASINGNLIIGKTLTTTSFINTYDASINGNLTIGKDITINGNLSVKQYQAQSVINTTTTNYQLIVSEDISLNGRLFVSNDASFNGNCYVKTRLAVGTTTPQYTLDISSASTQPFRVGIGATNAIVVSSTGKVGIGSASPIVALDVNGALNINGFVGIGITNPSTPLHIAANTVNISTTGARYFNTTTSPVTGISNFNNIVAYMEGSIITNQSFIGINTVTFSDERIKKNIMSLSDVQSTTLQKFREIQPKIFQYIDTIQYGTIEQYGFIAQEIEKVLPSAIQYQTMYIPSIYEIADVSYNNGSYNTITIHEKSTNQFEYDASNNLFTKLKCYDVSNNEIIIYITNIIDDNTFEFEFETYQTKEPRLFIYGQEVNNYRSINYDTLFMLSFFVTQELDKEMQNTKQEIKALKQELTNVLIKLTEVATNCCNIDQDFQH